MILNCTSTQSKTNPMFIYRTQSRKPKQPKTRTGPTLMTSLPKRLEIDPTLLEICLKRVTTRQKWLKIWTKQVKMLKKNSSNFLQKDLIEQRNWRIWLRDSTKTEKDVRRSVGVIVALVPWNHSECLVLTTNNRRGRVMIICSSYSLFSFCATLWSFCHFIIILCHFFVSLTYLLHYST